MGAVTQYVATIPVSGDVHGDISYSVTKVAEKLTALGYGAIGRAIQTSTGWGGSPIYGKVQFTLRRQGKPFEEAHAQRDLNAVAGSIGLKLGGLATWALSVVKFTSEAPGTSAQGVVDAAQAVGEKLSEAQQRYKDCIAKGGTALTCAGPSAGIPSWVWWVGGAAVGLYVLNSVVAAKKTFLGGVPQLGGSSRQYTVWAFSAGTGRWTSVDYGRTKRDAEDHANAIKAEIAAGPAAGHRTVRYTAVRVTPDREVPSSWKDPRAKFVPE